MDVAKNFAKATVATGYSAGATSITVTSGGGARLAVGEAVWWNATTYADPADDPNREIIRITAIASNTLTVSRGQQGTTASSKNASGKTYKIAQGPTAKLFNEDLMPRVTTTKGDLAGYSTVPERIPVGADGRVLTADSSEDAGVRWAPPSIITPENGGTLDEEAEIGATSITVTSVPLGIGPNSGYVCIDPFTVDCEIREIASIVGLVINLVGSYPLLNEHAAGTPVLALIGSGPVPWTLFGAKANTQDPTAVSNNVLGFNRLSENLYNLTLRGPARIFIPAGVFYVDDELTPERDIGIEGASVVTSQIAASDDFVFDDTGEIAIIHPKRDGLPVLYATPGPSGRWFMKDLIINGRELANSNGILSSPQQPDHWENLQVVNTRGLYGICLADVQQHAMRNIELINNTVGLRYRSASFVFVDVLNIEQSGESDFIAEVQGGGGGGCSHNRFENIHIETETGATGDLFNIQAGDGWVFENVWCTNLDEDRALFYFATSGGSSWQGPIYSLKNIRCNSASTNFKMVEDIDRNFTITSESAKRWIHDLRGMPHPLAGNTPGLRFPGLGGDDLRLGTPSITGGANVKSKVATNGGKHLSCLNGSDAEKFFIDDYGRLRIKATDAPADGDLGNSDMAIWLDPTPGSTKFKIKAKDSGGTVRTGEIALS